MSEISIESYLQCFLLRREPDVLHLFFLAFLGLLAAIFASSFSLFSFFAVFSAFFIASEVSALALTTFSGFSTFSALSFLVSSADEIPAREKRDKETRVINNFYADELEAYFRCPCKKDNYIVSVANGFGKRKEVDKGFLVHSVGKSN